MTRHALHFQITCSCGNVINACGCKIVPAGTALHTETRDNGCENCQTIEADANAKAIRMASMVAK